MLSDIRPAIVSMVLFTAAARPRLSAGDHRHRRRRLPRTRPAAAWCTTPSGQVIGSSLIAQGFAKAEYLHPRPSAAGNGYDPTSSGRLEPRPAGPELSPSAIARRRRRAAQVDRRDPQIPADAMTTSGSGLDPDISPAYAELQVAASPRRAAPRADAVQAGDRRPHRAAVPRLHRPAARQRADDQSGAGRAVSEGASLRRHDARRAAPPRSRRASGRSGKRRARPAQGLPRHGAGGRQDLRDAGAGRRGAKPRASTWWSAWSRPTAARRPRR